MQMTCKISMAHSACVENVLVATETAGRCAADQNVGILAEKKWLVAKKKMQILVLE